MPIKIEAVLLVPDLILTGVCFPDFPVEFRYPHANILYGSECAQSTSYNLMRAVKTQYPYSKAYSDLKDSGTADAEIAGLSVWLSLSRQQAGYTYL